MDSALSKGEEKKLGSMSGKVKGSGELSRTVPTSLVDYDQNIKSMQRLDVPDIGETSASCMVMKFPVVGCGTTTVAP